MKVLVYSDHFFPLVGGVQTFVNLLAGGFGGLKDSSAADHADPVEITVVTNTPSGEMDDSSLPYRVVRRPNLWHLIRLIQNAELVQFCGPCLLPMTISGLIGKPTLVEHHGYQAVCPNGLLLEQPLRKACRGHFMERRYLTCLRCRSSTIGRLGAIRSVVLTFPRRWLCKRVAANVSITRHVGRRIGLPRPETIYYGIDVTENQSNCEQLFESPTPQIAYVGRLVEEKGLPLLLRAAKQLRDSGRRFKLSFIGDGPERTRLEQMALELGLSELIKFTGYLSGTDFDRAVSAVAIVVMPSIWEETAGLSAIEQMMRGRIVVAADIGGLSEIVGDAGMKFRSGDWEELASCIQQILDDRLLAQSLSSAARSRALQLFTRDRMTHEHASLYRETLSRMQRVTGR